MAHIAGISLTLLLAGTTVLEAQGGKPAPSKVGAPAQGVTGQAATAGPQSGAITTVMPSLLLPCCVLEGVETAVSTKGKLEGAPKRDAGVLVIKHTQTGQVERLRVPGATSAKYRPGQAVAMSLDRSALAITAFPVNDEKVRSKINGNSSWRMTTEVTVSKDGLMAGKTKTKSSEAMRGFTGGVEVLLTDRAAKVLYQTQLRTYGVNGTAMGGKSERTVNWTNTVPADALNKVSAVVIHHSYEPKVRLAAGIGWIKDNWDLVAKVFKCGSELLAADEEGQQPTGSPTPPPGQATTQPPPSDTSTLECIETTAELADSLGY